MLTSYNSSSDRIHEIAYFLYLASKTYDNPSGVLDFLQFDGDFADNKIQSVQLFQTPKIFNEATDYTRTVDLLLLLKRTSLLLYEVLAFRILMNSYLIF